MFNIHNLNSSMKWSKSKSQIIEKKYHTITFHCKHKYPPRILKPISATNLQQEKKKKKRLSMEGMRGGMYCRVSVV